MSGDVWLHRATASDPRSGRILLPLAIGVLVVLLVLSGCASQPREASSDAGVPERIARIPDAVPKVEPLAKSGNPASYVVFGKRYYTKRNSRGHVERGLASWYGKQFHGRKTSSGESYDMYGMTAAHKTLPLPTYARVTNLANDRSVVVRINDRGPFHGERIIDLSYSAAVKLGMAQSGTAPVEVRVLDPRRPVRQRRPVRERSALGFFTASSEQAQNAHLYLQLGAFGDRRNAERLRLRLASYELTGAVEVLAPDAAVPLYKVRVGPLTSEQQARRLSRELADLGLDEVPRLIRD